jgi:hypothetical protein
MLNKLTKFACMIAAWICSGQLVTLAGPACSDLPVNGMFQSAYVVFTGKVIEANRKDWRGYGILYDRFPPFLHLLDFDLNRTTFDVSTVWKDDLPASTNVIHKIDGGCFGVGIEFQPGEEWLIYARRVEGELRVFDGVRFDKLCDAKEDLAALGPGKPPLPNPTIVAALPYPLAVLFILLSLLLGGLSWAWRRYGI